MCMDAQLTCQNCIDLQANKGDALSPCIMEKDVEKEDSQARESEEEVVESLKSGGIPVSFNWSSSYCSLDFI